jgi:hypothetical protein
MSEVRRAGRFSVVIGVVVVHDAVLVLVLIGISSSSSALLVGIG